MPETSGLENKLPVFTSPHSQLTFCADDPTSYRQILIIMNPYDFEVKFKVLVSCSDFRKYTVSASMGMIKPQHSANVVLEHKAPTANNIGISDKVRVLIFGTGQIRASGKRDLLVTLVDTLSSRMPSMEVENFHQLESNPATLGHLRQQPLSGPMHQEPRSNNRVIYIIAMLAGVVTLAMPKEGDFSEYFPSVLPRPTSEMKLMVAYLLGVVSVLLLQS